MSEHPHVQFGEHSLPVYEQAPMRIIKRLGRLRDAFTGATTEGGFDTQVLFNSLGNRVYYLFQTFITNLPERMPEWEFWGYSSRDAYEARDFDEERDGGNAATFTQWLDAFDLIVEVHGGKRFFDLIGNVIPLEIVRAELGVAISEWRENTGLLNSPGPSGTSLPTNSGMTLPDSAERDTPHESENGSQTENSSGTRLPIPA